MCGLLASACSANGWHNSNNPLDVSGDTVLAPDDLLIVANELLQHVDPIATNGELPVVSTAPPFLDTNDDCFLTPIDLLLILNSVNGDNDPWLHGVPTNTTLSPSNSAIEFRLSDSDGNLITQANVGSTVFLTAILIDDAATSVGAFAGYLDLGFDESLVSATQIEIPNSNTFANEGTLNPGLITGIGSGAANLADLLSEGLGARGVPELELFSVAFSVEEVGVVDFTGANGASLVFGNNDWLSPTLTGASLTIVPEPNLCGWILLVLGAVQFAAFRHR